MPDRHLSLGLHTAVGVSKADSGVTDQGVLDWIDAYRLVLAADRGLSEPASRHLYPSMLGLWSSWNDTATYAGTPGPSGRVFPTNTLMNGLASRGITPMFNAAPTGPAAGDPNHGHFTLQRILDGEWDPVLDGWSQDYLAWRAQVRGFSAQCNDQKPIVLYRWAWEMNAPWNPWSAGQEVSGETKNTPAIYRRVWQHVRQRIRVHNGASGVKFVWCPWSPGATVDLVKPWYPGDAYVDYTAFDAYSNGTNDRPSGQAIYSHGVSVVSQVAAKPIIISETGIGHDSFSDSDRAQWIADALAYLRNQTAVRGYIYYNFGDPNRFYEPGSGPWPLARGAWAAKVDANPTRIWE